MISSHFLLPDWQSIEILNGILNNSFPPDQISVGYAGQEFWVGIHNPDLVHCIESLPPHAMCSGRIMWHDGTHVEVDIVKANGYAFDANQR